MKASSVSDREMTHYSAEVDGDRGNSQQRVRFDVTDGYVGITQWPGPDAPASRVLLSPAQLTALRAFLREDAQ